MFDFSSLPLTPDNARAARNYLGLSQAKAAEESELPAHKIKRFEAGNYIPDEAFLVDLREFFEGRGYEFQDTQKPGARARAAGKVFPAGVVGESEENHGAPAGRRPAKTAVHHMRIAITDEAEMGRVLDLIEANEARAEELLRKPAQPSFFGLSAGGLSEESQANHAAVLKCLAENGTLFARLFGRLLGGPPKPDMLKGEAKPETHADLLHRSQADAHLIAASGDREAIARRQAEKAPATLLSALFG